MVKTGQPKADNQEGERERPQRARSRLFILSSGMSYGYSTGSRAWCVYLMLGVFAVCGYLVLLDTAVNALTLYTAIALPAVVAIVTGTRPLVG